MSGRGLVPSFPAVPPGAAEVAAVRAARNPFRTAWLRKTFAETIDCYCRGGSALFGPDSHGGLAERRGNSWSAAFWNGVHGTGRVPEAGSQPFAMYRAGQVVARARAAALGAGGEL